MFIMTKIHLLLLSRLPVATWECLSQVPLLQGFYALKSISAVTVKLFSPFSHSWEALHSSHGGFGSGTLQCLCLTFIGTAHWSKLLLSDFTSSTQPVLSTSFLLSFLLSVRRSFRESQTYTMVCQFFQALPGSCPLSCTSTSSDLFLEYFIRCLFLLFRGPRQTHHQTHNKLQNSQLLSSVQPFILLLASRYPLVSVF